MPTDASCTPLRHGDLLRLVYEKILPLTSVIYRGDYILFIFFLYSFYILFILEKINIL